MDAHSAASPFDMLPALHFTHAATFTARACWHHLNLTCNALPVDVASGSCPEVRFWSITLLARSLCSTCPRSRFLGSFTDHFDGLPTSRTGGPLSVVEGDLERLKIWLCVSSLSRAVPTRP